MTSGEANGSATQPIPSDKSKKSDAGGIENGGLEMTEIDETDKGKAAGSEVKEEKWGGATRDMKDKSKPWKELTWQGKVVRVLWNYISKPLILIFALYLFICSLDILSSAFRLIGGKAAGKAFADNELLQNPVAGLMVGVLATVLVQSSSTTSSIVISMVAGKVMYVRTAIPIIMGANIGTSVTNTIVSMGHVGDVDEFRRAFGGATIHDMFNWLSVIVFLPLEEITHYLEYLTDAIVNSMPLESYEAGEQEMLKAITKPLTKLVISVDTSQITEIATHHGDTTDVELIKIWCKFNTTSVLANVTNTNMTEIGGTNITNTFIVEEMVSKKIGISKCVNMFMDVSGVWSDEVIGAVLLVMALLLLCGCLVVVVKILNSILEGSIANALKKFVNADLPGKFSWLTGYLAIIVGAGLTIVVQSSSVFTSTLTPLVGVGVLQLDRMYPLTLGSNIGTTATGMLASLAASGDTLRDSLQIAFCHLFFNISGILLWFPIPVLRKVPIKFAMVLGDKTAKYRWFAIFYLFMMFFVLPGIVFGLSLAGWYVLLAVAGPIVIIIIIVIIINAFQNKCPSRLPKRLRSWTWLPLCMRSLEPLDRLFRTVCFCCKSCRQPQESVSVEPVSTGDDDVVPIVISRELSREHSTSSGRSQSKRNGDAKTPKNMNADLELGGTKNKAFEQDETVTESKPEVTVVTETETNQTSESKPEPEVGTVAETETVGTGLDENADSKTNRAVAKPDVNRTEL